MRRGVKVRACANGLDCRIGLLGARSFVCLSVCLLLPTV
jgi:hypothetical protein